MKERKLKYKEKVKIILRDVKTGEEREVEGKKESV
jgi:hypothetical protein